MTEELDARGLKCPLPVLKIAKRMRDLPPGTALSVLADDPAALVDVPHYCAEQGHTLVSTEELRFPEHRFVVRKSD